MLPWTVTNLQSYTHENTLRRPDYRACAFELAGVPQRSIAPPWSQHLLDITTGLFDPCSFLEIARR